MAVPVCFPLASLPKRSQIIAHGLIYRHLNDFPSQSYHPALEILQSFSAPLPEKSKSLVYLYITLSARVGPSWLLLGVNSTSLSFPLQTGHMYRGGLFSLPYGVKPTLGQRPWESAWQTAGNRGKTAAAATVTCKGPQQDGRGMQHQEMSPWKPQRRRHNEECPSPPTTL